MDMYVRAPSNCNSFFVKSVGKSSTENDFTLTRLIENCKYMYKACVHRYLPVNGNSLTSW